MQPYAEDWNVHQHQQHGYNFEPTTIHHYQQHQQVRAHSVLSGGSGFDDYQDPYSYGLFSQDQIDDINAEYEATRAYRIRRAMFPETIEAGEMGGNEQAAPSSYDLGQSNNVQRLADPSQMLKTAVVNIINYQEDADVTMKAIPELVKLLSDSDQAAVHRAIRLLHSLSKNDSALNAMANNKDLIRAVVALTAKNSDNPELAHYAAAALYNISRHDRGVLAIFESGGIPVLVRLLGSPVDSVVFSAISTLHNLLQHIPSAKNEVRVAGGVAKMVALLKKKHDKFLAIDTDCLHILTYEHPETKVSMLSCGAPAELVRIMRTSQYEKLLWTTSRLLQVLSVCPHNKPAIISEGGVQAVSSHLSNNTSVVGGGQRLILSCLLTLRNLSDAATKEENIEGLLKSLVQLLDSNDPKVVACSVGILSNLTCNNQRNKACICRSGGVEALIRVLQQNGKFDDISEGALCTLRHLTCRHPDVERAQNAVRLNYGIQQVCHYLQYPLPSTVRQSSMKAALGLVRNLVANNGPNLTTFREHGVVKSICSHLITAFQQEQRNNNGNGQGGPGPVVVDGVTAMEVAENATGALHALAKDPLNRNVIRQMNIIPILVQLLYYDNENGQRFATGCLSELANDPDGAQIIEQQGAVALLTELMHSRNDHIRAYAGATMQKLSKDKPAEYQKHLSLEISSSLVLDDSAPWGQDGSTEIRHMQEGAFGDGTYQHAYGPVPTGPAYAGGNGSAPAWDSSFTSSSTHPAAGGGGGGYNSPTHHAPQPGGNQLPGWYDTDL